MRYIGSKRTVLPFIKTTIEETYGNISNAIVADLFAGTACVGEMFKREGARVLSKDFQEFLGNSEAFDFYCEYAKFDFSRFDVSWLLNLYPHTLEQIAKNAKVKERVRVAIATTLDGEAIAPSDSQRLQSILVKHFC